MSNHKKKDTSHVSEEIKPHVMEVDDLDPFSQVVLGLVDRKSRFDLKKMEVIKEFWLMYDSMYQPMKRTASIFAAALYFVRKNV